MDLTSTIKTIVFSSSIFFIAFSVESGYLIVEYLSFDGTDFGFYPNLDFLLFSRVFGLKNLTFVWVLCVLYLSPFLLDLLALDAFLTAFLTGASFFTSFGIY